MRHRLPQPEPPAQARHAPTNHRPERVRKEQPVQDPQRTLAGLRRRTALAEIVHVLHPATVRHQRNVYTNVHKFLPQTVHGDRESAGPDYLPGHVHRYAEQADIGRRPGRDHEDRLSGPHRAKGLVRGRQGLDGHFIGRGKATNGHGEAVLPQVTV